jgi:CubicO group peptidase (beta-lactamase class C family)
MDAGLLADSPESAGVDPEKLEALFVRAEREVAEGLLPSVQIAVARRGRVAGMRSFGRVTRQGEPGATTDDTLYCVFSCTKAVTSAAAWLLIQEGKLDVGEAVAAIVPEFGSHGKDEIRVEQLFTHTAGFPRAPFRPHEFLDRERRLARFSSWRLNWPPGSRFEYHPSSSMYVIAEIIERLSGLAYGDFVRQRIAEPLGLGDLLCGLPEDQQPRMADLVHVGEEPTEADYARRGFPKPPVTEVTEEAIGTFNLPEVRRAGIPGGGATTTAATLALFYQALLGDAGESGPGVWQASMLRDALTVRNPDFRDPVFKKPANRALGVVVAGGEGVYRGFGHTNSEHAFGHMGAGGQIGWGDPSTGISLGYCTNGFDRDPMRMGRRIVGISSRAGSLALD